MASDGMAEGVIRVGSSVRITDAFYQRFSGLEDYHDASVFRVVSIQVYPDDHPYPGLYARCEDGTGLLRQVALADLELA